MIRLLARCLAGSLLALLASCSPNAESHGPPAGGGGAGGGGGDTGGTGGAGGGNPCECVPGPHESVIYVLSSKGEIWAFDPVAGTFTYVTTPLCAGITPPFSMAVDQRGHAWILSASTSLVFDVDLVGAPDTCEKSVYTPHQASFDLFGMAFVAREEPSACPDLYVLSYSGEGAFKEGPGIGSLGVVDPATGKLTVLGPVDYDGGELAGTGNGRLFAFAGASPAKVIEYDKSTAAPLSTTVLEGFAQTNAAAAAFFGGALYFFTEAPAAECSTCLAASCPADHDACLADPVCAEALDCAQKQGDITDRCGGLMPSELQACLTGPCLDACFIPAIQKVSQVGRLYLDQPGAPEIVVPQAPIRIVGAGSSPCVPVVPK